MNNLFPIGSGLLEQFGEFYPTGGVISVNGAFEAINVLPDSEKSTPTDVLNTLSAALAVGMCDGRFRSTGVCLNVRTVDDRTKRETDALQMILSHKKGEVIYFFVPYSKKDGKHKFQETFFRK